MSANPDLLPPATKFCTKCGVEKLLGEFNRDKSHKDGYRSHCKSCSSERHKAYRHAHRDDLNEQQSIYHQANRDRLNEQRRLYRLSNRDQTKERNRAYYRANREALRAYNKAYMRTRGLTPEGYTTSLWHALNTRTINGSCPQWNNKGNRAYLKAGVELRLTRQQLCDFVTEKWDTIQAIRAEGGIPSIDRIGPSIHYELENCRFISWSENNHLASRKWSRLKCGTSR